MKKKQKKIKKEKIKYFINKVEVSKRRYDKEEAFHKKYDSYPRVKKTCLNCDREVSTIEELRLPCPFCKAPFDFEPNKIMRGFLK